MSTSASTLAFMSGSTSASAANPITLSVSALALIVYFSFSEVFSILVDLVAAVYLDALLKSGFMFVSIE